MQHLRKRLEKESGFFIRGFWSIAAWQSPCRTERSSLMLSDWLLYTAAAVEDEKQTLETWQNVKGLWYHYRQRQENILITPEGNCCTVVADMMKHASAAHVCKSHITDINFPMTPCLWEKNNSFIYWPHLLKMILWLMTSILCVLCCQWQMSSKLDFPGESGNTQAKKQPERTAKSYMWNYSMTFIVFSKLACYHRLKDTE